VKRLPHSGAAEATVAARPEQVWAVLSDVTRVGEWSGECRGATWLDGATAAVPGARFRGTNRVRWVRWARVSSVEHVDPGRELRWRTHGPAPMWDSTRWSVRLDPDGEGTRIRQHYQVVTLPAFWDRVFVMLLPEHRDRIAGLTADLRRLGAVAARTAPSRP
jgi:hypothetical protein